MENNSAKKRTESGRQRGLNSPFGMEASICSTFHWSLEYLQWHVSWVRIQLMLADMPGYDYSEDSKDENVHSLDDIDDTDILRKLMEDAN